MTRDLGYEMHLFVCPQYDPRKGAYPRVLNSRAYRQFRSAEANHDSEVDMLFHNFLTHGGPDFWSQLAEFLAACHNAKHAFLDDPSRHPLCDGLNNYSDDDDGLDILTPHAEPPVPSLRIYVSVSRTQKGSLLCAF
jgi:hypothetical protein